MSKQVEELTADNFSDVIGKGTTVVDFWAPWCAPCKKQSPIVEEAAREAGDSVRAARLNVEEASDVAAEHNIRSVPSIVIFKDGNEAKRFTSFQKKEALIQAIEEIS